MGFEITLVEDGEKLIETLRSKPDLVIANVFLPGKLGVEACEWMKAQPDLHYIPFILIGSLFRVERYRRPANSLYGADDYIEEGIPNDEFRGIVHRLTGFGVSGHGAVQSPLEEHLRRKVRIHLDTMTGGDRIQGPMGPRIKELVSAIIKDSPNTDPALVEKIAGEYLTGMEGDHDRDQ